MFTFISFAIKMRFRSANFIIIKRLFSTTIIRFQYNVPVRVRFAPSPTGNIHLGGLRTALYNYIFARQNNGKFVLRLEDTDRNRLVEGSAKGIEETLNWAGLKPDESPSVGGDYGPYLQSERLEVYQRRAQELLSSGLAYRCFCSPMRLDLLRNQQSRNREKPRYDGKCKHLSPSDLEEKLEESGDNYAIRFALKPGPVAFNDLIFGSIKSDLLGSYEGDPIIIKSDQYPTYHFANVVDDHEMRISHVLRGSEWITSTAKHIQLYQAFKWEQPKFAHFPLILMVDGRKMSKRNDQSQVISLRGSGFTPLAIINFLTNTGGGVPKEKQDRLDLWDLDMIVNNFKFDRVTCHPGSADMSKLSIYNSKDLQKTWSDNPQAILHRFKDLLIQNDIETDADDDFLTTVVDRLIVRISSLNDLISNENEFIWRHPELTWSPQEYLGEIDLKGVLEGVIDIIKNSESQDKVTLDARLKILAGEQGMSWPSLMKLMRRCLTNNNQGLPVYEIFGLLGKDRLLSYLYKALKYIS